MSGTLKQFTPGAALYQTPVAVFVRAVSSRRHGLRTIIAAETIPSKDCAVCTGQKLFHI